MLATKSRQPGIRAEADTETIADLVSMVKRGVVRVPSFQRGLRWDGQDVLGLYDSIYSGYPIGSLLLRKGPAAADRIVIGPVAIDAPATQSGLWVIDGQQRLTALTAGLARPGSMPTAPDDPYVVYFDAAAKKFVTPKKSGRIPDQWVPVNQLLDSASLTEWVFNWSHASDVDLRRSVFEVGTRLREYNVPLYIVETDDEQLLREIFYRINNYGKSLRWEEVHKALFGGATSQPSTIDQLSDELSQLGMGRPREEHLLPCVLGVRGLDVTQTLAVHYRRDPAALREAVADSLPALKSAFLFLKSNASIPHLRLLPRITPLPVLSRFFALHPSPGRRTVELLVRWTWRTLMNAARYDERTLLRHGVAAIDPTSEDASAQTLLKLVPGEAVAFRLPDRFDARAADSRIALLGLVSCRPRDLNTGRELDVAALIESDDVAAFRKISSRSGTFTSSPANRLVHPGTGDACPELREIASRGGDSKVLRSHAITDSAARHLAENDLDGFLTRRADAVTEIVRVLLVRQCGWSRGDRPSLPYLLRERD